MKWLSRPKLQVAVAAALILATAGVAVQGRQQPAPKGAQEQAKAVLHPTAGVPAVPDKATPVVPDLAANRALARKQLAVIDETWAFLGDLAQHGVIDIDTGTFGPWGRRRLEALHRAGAGKAEIVAALEKYINDLERLLEMRKARHDGVARSPTRPIDINEIRFLSMEAEIWLNEEKAR